MIEIEIDGKKVEVAAGSMVMHAAEKAGTYIPHFCYHKKLSIAANCRMCLVDIEKAPKAMPACATPVTQGMIVRTKSDKAIKAQQSVMEFLLINHPLDCPICDQGGECQLQDLAVGYGGSASRYTEEKRVMFPKNVGPLVSMQEMSRCIQCTRCVRFGQEVAGVMELGMTHRGEHSEIETFVGRGITSELSGNMIDICPVGALTSKPFRYSARTWELARRRSVSPHDSVGANLIVQVKANKVMRVVPFENEEVNECWISDRDRFSYEGLNSDTRLTQPMLRQGDHWKAVDWSVALEYVANGLKNVKAQHGATAIGSVASASSTVEELHLLAQLTRGLGSENLDHRLRHSDFANVPTAGSAHGLGRSIASLANVDRALVVGSFLRKDHPLLAQRLRQAARHGAQIHSVNALHEDWLLAQGAGIVAAPSAWVQALADIASAVAAAKGVAAPVAGSADAHTQDIANSLLSGQQVAILLGNAAAQHPQATSLLALANWIATETGATVGYLGEAANNVGAQLLNVLPGSKGLNAAQMLAADAPLKALVVLACDPVLDSANASAAAKAMAKAEMVVVLATHQGHYSDADVLLPIAPFTETSGSLINAEGRLQTFTGVVKPLGEARPAWKVLRVLGSMLDLPNFAYETSDEVRRAAIGTRDDFSSNLSNGSAASIQTPNASSGIERLADVPIYATDSLVRNATSLQLTQDAKSVFATLPTALWSQLGLKAGDQVVVHQEGQSVRLAARLDATLAATVVRVPAGLADTAALGAMFGALTVVKV